MSISPNVGALNKYLTRILSSRTYSGARESGKKLLKHIPPVMELAKRTEEHMKGMVVPATMFEELGFQYFGPVDGHDLPNLVKVLNNLKAIQGPLLLHAITKKGKGYKYAEEDALALHAVTPFDPDTGKKHASGKKASGPTYTEVFGNWICDMAAVDDTVIGITPAMREGSGLVEFEKQFPDRYFDVGIAEQHSVTLAAGLACEGMKPVVAIYSTFMQRAYDQVVHDVAVQNLNVLFAVDRAGLVGPDGPTHAGNYDFAYLRCLPNVSVMAPADENECRQMLYTGLQHEGPVAVRYPRGTGPGVTVEKEMTALPWGKADVVTEGSAIALLAFGSMVEPAKSIARKIGATVVNMRFVVPLDESTIKNIASSHDLLVTIEENTVAGGAGSAINECLHRMELTNRVLNIGLPNCYDEHGERNELLAQCHLDEAGIEQQINQFMSKTPYSAVEEKLTVTQ